MNLSSKVVANIDGKEVLLFRINGASGRYAEITNYGATLTAFVVPDKTGDPKNIILSYENIEEYFTDNSYIGSTVGRYANRISNARFSLGGKTYFLDKNDGNNSNHGGFSGFNSKIFDYKTCGNKLVLSYESPDGEGGFPGNLSCSVTYSFTDDNGLQIEYRAVSDKETIFNPTNHAYFNLSGSLYENRSGSPSPDLPPDILNHELKVFADSYLETNNDFIPTGKILPVKDSAFDFSDYKAISDLMPLKNEVLKGYNTYFISNSGEQLKHLASLREPKSEIVIKIFSTMPGVQVYTGDYLSGKHQPFSGICLEAQFYPDAPNHPGFKNCILKPNIETVHKIVFI